MTSNTGNFALQDQLNILMNLPIVKRVFYLALVAFLLCSPWSSPTCFGEVQVQRVGNGIFITGDNQANSVQVVPGSESSIEVIIDFDFDNPINLGSFEIDEIVMSLEAGNDFVFIRNLAFDSFFADLGGGDDNIIFDDSLETITGDIDVVLGAGNDEVYFELLETLQGDLNIEMNGGDDSLILSPFNVGGDFTCSMGAGNDRIRNDGFLPGLFAVMGDTIISTAGGNDTVSLLTLDTSGGEIANVVFFGGLEISLGGGNDELNLEVGVGLDTEIKMGGGNDCLAISPSTHGLDATTFCGDVVVRGGGGSDEVTFGDTLPTFFEQDFQFFGGRGRDIFITNSQLKVDGRFDVTLGLGNDFLEFDLNGNVAIPGTLNGGSGRDTLSPNVSSLENFGFTVLKFEN